MIKKLNSAVVGLGFGERHLKCFRKNKFTNLVDFFDFDKKKNDKFKKEFKIKSSNSFKELINKRNLNFLVIASYDNYHFSMVSKAIAKKINFFVEKPLCQTFKQLDKIRNNLKKTENRKIKFSINMVLRAHPKFKKIYEIVKSGAIGKIYHIEGEYNYGRFEKLKKGWRGKIPFYSVTQGGGVHILDLIHWITKVKFERVISTSNSLNSKKTNFKYPDTTISLLELQNGITAKLTSNFSIFAPHHHVLNIHGSKGSIFSNREASYMYKSNKKKTKKIIIKYQNNKNYKEEILKKFIYYILKKEKDLNSRESIFHVMQTALTIDKSLKSKKWERVKF